MDIRQTLLSNPRLEAEAAIQQNTRNAYLGRGRLLCVVLGKYKMYVHADDVGFSPHMIFEGFWEYWLTAFMAKVVQPGDVVCDIGANLGYYSILLSDLVGAGGRVVAVEPNPVVCADLGASLALNGFSRRCEVLNCAFVEREGEGEARFFVPANEPKNGTLVSETPARGGKTMTVRTRNINSLDFDRLDFVKIDVEGAELGILRSLQDLKERLRPKIVAEVNFGRGYGYDEIASLIGTGGELLHVDFNAKVVPLTREMARDERIDEDWLVYWPGRAPD